MKPLAVACAMLVAACAPGYHYVVAAAPQHCAAADVDPGAPALGPYLDLEAATLPLANLPLQEGERALLSIRRAPDPDSISLDVFHPQFHESDIEAVRRALRPHLQSSDITERAAWGAISSGAERGVRPLSGAVECMPAPLDPAALYATFVSALPRPDRSQGRAVIRARVGMSGEVIEAHVRRSSESRNLDAAARQAVSEAKFSPATIDGMPVPVWVELPFEVRRRRLF
jgi:TonB family protein